MHYANKQLTAELQKLVKVHNHPAQVPERLDVGELRLQPEISQFLDRRRRYEEQSKNVRVGKY